VALAMFPQMLTVLSTGMLYLDHWLADGELEPLWGPASETEVYFYHSYLCVTAKKEAI
jgi:hypothetical protein